MQLSEATFKRVALEHPEGHRELYGGQLRSKPGMTVEHNDLATELNILPRTRLCRDHYQLQICAGRLRRTELSHYSPGVSVLPTAAVLQQRGTRKLEPYSAPLPLMVEIWSPSTGGYVVREKMPE